MAPKTNKRKTNTTKQHVSSDEEEILQISDKDVEFLGTPNIGNMWKNIFGGRNLGKFISFCVFEKK